MMRRRLKIGVGIGSLGLMLAGCGAPEVTTVLPPGAEVEHKVAEGDAAEAIGEAAGAVQPTTKPLANIAPAEPTKVGETKTTESKVQYETLQEGTGPEAKPGQEVTVHYTGTLTNGTKFDSSRDRGQSFKFRIGTGQVIPGWDQGVTGMKVGERRKLTIPPELGYGSEGAGNKIPPNSTLVFDIELLKVQ